MLKVAMAGKWHVHAEGYARDFNAQSDSRVTAVWDDDVRRGSAWAAEIGAAFFESYDEMLEKGDFDAVCVTSATSMHKELMLKAAARKKHIFTEKVMCLTAADCDEVIRAINGSGVVFTISFPHRCFAQNLYIKQAIESGMLGKITLFRTRNCHAGALQGWLPDYWFDPDTTGGGAMMDLGAHPMYLANWMLGKPVSVVSSFKRVTGREVDDDAVSVLTFENGASAIVETSLVAPFTPQICEVYGTKGVILREDKKLRVKTNDAEGWIEPELPEDMPSPLRQFTDSVLYGAPVRFGTKEARTLTLMMEKAYEAEREGRRVEIP